MTETIQVHVSIATAAVGLLLWLVGLVVLARRGRRELRTVVTLRALHGVQFFCHSAIWATWALSVPLVARELPLIGCQIVFAYLFDLCMSWTRRRPWVLGFGPIPIVLSTNLFLWFKDDLFGWQLGLIAVVFLSREFLRWERPAGSGRSTHIFNPSAAGLLLASIGLILTQSTGRTWGEEIATTPGIAPHMFDVIFLTGVVLQSFFSVTLMTLTAGISFWVLGTLYFAATGNYFFLHTTIPIAVFLGMTLLLTDPATSPNSRFGKAFFGFGYALGVMGLFVVLGKLGVPQFYDTLIPVPFLNLLVPLVDRHASGLAPYGPMRRAFGAVVDRMGTALDARLPKMRRSPRALNLVHVGIWIVVYLFMRPGLVDHPGARAEQWRAPCAQGQAAACGHLIEVLRVHCELQEGPACQELAEYFGDERRIDFDAGASKTYRRLACKAGQATSCEAPKGVSIDRSRGPACDGGDAQACADSAGQLLTGQLGKVDVAGAIAAYGKACDGGVALACANLGLFALQGHGMPVDKPQGFALHLKACGLGLGVACGRVASLYEHGEGVTADPEQALVYFRKACDLGDRGACRRVP